ncbi:MAG: transposase [Pseudobdellovibrio sp.]|nr:transposase [Pseudobdellovibrio sp.]
MARKLLIRTSQSPYHITGRSNNKEFFYVDLETLWEIFLQAMESAENLFSCDFHAFVLMSNHYHLLISTPLSNIDKVMEHIQREVAKKANRKSARINHFFGGPYKWSLIYEEPYYWNAVKYIFRNPVRAGLCSDVLEYKYSSLNARGDQKIEWKMATFFAIKQS